MARKSLGNSTVAMLDLLSCAFGGVLILAIALAAMIDSEQSKDHESYLIIHLEVDPQDGSPELQKILQESGRVELILQEPSGCLVEVTDNEFETVVNAFGTAVNAEECDQRKKSYRYTVGATSTGLFATLLVDELDNGLYTMGICPWVATINVPEAKLNVDLVVRHSSRSTPGVLRPLPQVATWNDFGRARQCNKFQNVWASWTAYVEP